MPNRPTPNDAGSRLQPGTPVRLAFWLAIYLAAAVCDASTTAVYPRWNFTPNLFFWHVALRLPEDLQLLIAGLLGLDSDGIGSKIAMFASYLCYLFNFGFCNWVPGKKWFWLMIVMLIVLILLAFCGSSWYVRTTFKTI